MASTPPARTQEATHRGVRISYSVTGNDDRPALVLIRGWTRTRGGWTDLRRRLMTNFRLVELDNRGVGESSRPWVPWSTAAMADDVAAVLDDAAIERAHVFGSSMGGMIAQRVAIRHPERVDRLILSSTRAGPGRGGKLPSPVLARLLRILTMRSDDAIAASAWLVLSDRFVRAHPEHIQQSIEESRRRRKNRRGDLLQLVAAATHDADAELKDLPHETLVITGDVDRFIPPSCAHHLRDRIPRARLAVVPGAGHELCIEAAEQVAELVEAFLGAVAPCRAPTPVDPELDHHAS